jgi:predicted dehydrogenase
MNNHPPLKIGILGAATIAPMALIRPARKVAAVQVAAVAARDPARAQAFARKYQIPRVHDSYDALLADPELEAIYNPLPNSLHCQWTIRALQAGKHVLCEKPMAANAAEAQQMAETAAQTGRLLVEAFHYRYHPLMARVKEILDSGEIGRPQYIEAYFQVPIIQPGNIRYRFDLAGGAMMDAGCYTLNLVRFLAGQEPEVTAAQARLSSPNVDRWMQAELRFPDGGTGRIVCSLFSAVLFRSRALIRGEHGEVRVSNPFFPQVYNRIQVRGRQGKRSERISGETTYVYQLQAFVRAVQGEAAMPTDAADAVANMRVIDAIYQKAGLPPRGT